MLTWRDVQQFLSLALSLHCLATIAMKIRRAPRSFAIWLPMITIMLVTVIFYGLIQFNVPGLSSSDLSATRALTIQIALTIYVHYMPPRGTA